MSRSIKYLKWFALYSLLIIGVSLSAAPSADSSNYVQSVVGDSTHWTATNWNSEDEALFGGEPQYRGDDKHLILLRYSYFVSQYDEDKLCPLWVAHVDESDSESKEKSRKDGEWGRADDKFRPDTNVVTYSASLNQHFVTDSSYVDANPPEVPIGDKGYGKITRGHMASNSEMKSLGDSQQGLLSQKESFSLANVSPQMQHLNAPLWSKLESDCLVWASKLGRVVVITGPVFSPDTSQSPPVNKIYFTQGKDGVKIPIPTHFYKVIIGKIDGKLAAVGFLVPHRSDLSQDDLAEFVVSLRKIEQITNLNFMPLLGSNDAIENHTDNRWLALLSKTLPHR